jgi:proteasome lid subunit RPN8/RPN11
MLRISKPDYDLIRWEAERSYPRECCGILLGSLEGKERVVTMTVPCENTRTDSPENRYGIHPERVIAALKLARSRAENIVGFYHSHPDHPARCSGTDLEEAHWFECSYLITSVERGRAAATSSFVLTGSEQQKAFQAERIEIVAYRHPLPIAL